MRSINLIVYCILFSIIVSCKDSSTIDEKCVLEFINNHKDFDYSVFNQKAIYIRDYREGVLVILVHDLDTINHEALPSYVVFYSVKRKKIVNTERHLMPDSTYLKTDTSTNRKLVETFVDHNMNYLRCDSNANIHITIPCKPKQTLIYVPDNNKYPADSGFVKYDNNWYFESY